MDKADNNPERIFMFSRKHNNMLTYRFCQSFRKRRYEKITALAGIKPNHKVIDVGCGRGYSFEKFNRSNKVVGVDLYPSSKIFQPNFRYVSGCGSSLPFPDKSFDVGFSIGVLEHIFPLEKLAKTANEIQRVCKGYALVVPHRNTFLEPHYHMPYWQYYPERLKSYLVQHIFSKVLPPEKPPGSFIKLHYLTRNTWLQLFPGARIAPYAFAGPFIRNFIIYKPAC